MAPAPKARKRFLIVRKTDASQFWNNALFRHIWPQAPRKAWSGWHQLPVGTRIADSEATLALTVQHRTKNDLDEDNSLDLSHRHSHRAAFVLLQESRRSAGCWKHRAHRTQRTQRTRHPHRAGERKNENVLPVRRHWKDQVPRVSRRICGLPR